MSHSLHPAQPTQPLIRLAGVSRLYYTGETTIKALDDVSLDIHRGEFIAIMGQSGSGKSTLMNIVGCLDRPTRGGYYIGGVDVSGLSRNALASLRRETFGFIYQRYNLLSAVTAAENVEIPSIYAGIPGRQRKTDARALLIKLGMGDRIDHLPSELSGGQQQRVAIARALINNAQVILADEPTGALDSKSGEDVLRILKNLHKEGRTILLITHDPHVANHADRIVHLFDGRVTDDSPPVLPTAEKTTVTGTPDSRKTSLSLMYTVTESVGSAWRSLRANMFRTSLTLLGIIIGVASVITMLAIGDGSREKILEQMSALGTNLLMIRPGAPGIRGSGDIITLVPSDAAAIRDLPNIETVVPERMGRFTVRFGAIDYQTSVQATGSGLPVARDWYPESGTFFTERDVTGYAPVAVLGQTVKHSLFPRGENPIGKYLLVRNIPFEIIGVLSEKGASPGGADMDDAVFVPITTGLVRLFGLSYLNAITVRVSDVSKIEATQDAITELLLQRHRTEDFRVRNMASILDTITQTQNTLTMLLGAVAAISLLVGGIGVMNIMLVSVTERTREIGIRMASGARVRDILLQFNIEASFVCALGGLLGIVIGFATIWVLGSSGMSVVFSVLPPVLAFCCAFFTGVVFGYLPARKAALLNPVEALASE